jgi:cytochrome c-type biogenesis protein
MLGLLFGLALGPCTFAYMAPVLGVVFQTAGTNYFLAMIFLASFGLGHCSVIVGAGTLTGKVQKYLNWSEESRTILWIKRICGVLVILGGIYFLIIA